MAVKLEKLNLIVPIANIERLYPGGLQGCLREPTHVHAMGTRVWHDGYLFRDGEAKPSEMRELVKEWEARGFAATKIVDGRKVWADLCVIDVTSGVATLPCDWIIIDRAARTAHYRTAEPGELIGRAA